MAMKILRIPIALERSGNRRTNLYVQIADGLWPPPIRISRRSVGFPEHECDAVIAARVAEKTDVEIRALVARLVAARRDPA